MRWRAGREPTRTRHATVKRPSRERRIPRGSHRRRRDFSGYRCRFNLFPARGEKFRLPYDAQVQSPAHRYPCRALRKNLEKFPPREPFHRNNGPLFARCRKQFGTCSQGVEGNAQRIPLPVTLGTIGSLASSLYQCATWTLARELAVQLAGLFPMVIQSGQRLFFFFDAPLRLAHAFATAIHFRFG